MDLNFSYELGKEAGIKDLFKNLFKFKTTKADTSSILKTVTPRLPSKQKIQETFHKAEKHHARDIKNTQNIMLQTMKERAEFSLPLTQQQLTRLRNIKTIKEFKSFMNKIK